MYQFLTSFFWCYEFTLFDLSQWRDLPGLWRRPMWLVLPEALMTHRRVSKNLVGISNQKNVKPVHNVYLLDCASLFAHHHCPSHFSLCSSANVTNGAGCSPGFPWRLVLSILPNPSDVDCNVSCHAVSHWLCDNFLLQGVISYVIHPLLLGSKLWPLSLGRGESPGGIYCVPV